MTRLPLALAVAVPLCGCASGRPADPSTYPDQWVTYSGDYTGKRHSSLAQITPANVSQLRPVWRFKTGEEGPLETTPIVYDRTIYITGTRNTAYALDAATGREVWRYTRLLPADLKLCCNASNRGFAIRDDRLFLETLDAHLVALDRRSGGVTFDVVIDEISRGYSGTSAPLVVADTVMVGISGGEFSGRGFLDAYDSITGARKWRFWTIPANGEAGADSWPPTRFARAGGATWLTGTYDPELRLVYWGTGNPSPPYDDRLRRGDDLYTNSLVSLDVDTGALRWHYQFTPQDTHDWDANQIPVLADIPMAGRTRHAVIVANRNGFLYVLDRRTGELLLARPFVKTTWASQIGSDGRPVELLDQRPTEAGTLICPDDHGGTNFMSPSFDPQRMSFFVTVRETCARYFLQRNPGIEIGAGLQGGRVQGISQLRSGALRALDPTTGAMKWEIRYPQPGWSGVLSTRAGIVFSGDDKGSFMGIDADNGHELWRYNLGEVIRAAPITYMIDGRQFVAIAANTVVTAFAVP